MLALASISRFVSRICTRWKQYDFPEFSTAHKYSVCNYLRPKSIENKSVQWLFQGNHQNSSRSFTQSCAVSYSLNLEKRSPGSLPSDDGKNVIFEKENIWTVPNLLSTLRIVSSPFLGYLVLTHHYGWAFGLLAVSGVTDFIDGVIARQFKSQSSRIGSLLDPLADKCLITMLSLTLTTVGLIPLPLTALIISRDVALVGGSFYLRYITLPPPRTWSRYWDVQRSTIQVTPTLISKVNTVLQMGLIGLSLGAPLVDCVGHPILQALWYVTASTTIVSGVSYVVQMEGFRVLIKKKSKRTKSA